LISFWCIKLLNPFPKTTSVASSLLLYSFAIYLARHISFFDVCVDTSPKWLFNVLLEIVKSPTFSGFVCSILAWTRSWNGEKGGLIYVSSGSISNWWICKESPAPWPSSPGYQNPHQSSSLPINCLNIIKYILFSILG
jgi:hypothetical protein